MALPEPPERPTRTNRPREHAPHEHAPRGQIALALQPAGPGRGMQDEAPEAWLALHGFGSESDCRSAAACALDFTPRVSLECPTSVLLEVRGSFRLFGGARRLCERVQARLRQERIDCTGWALAPTAAAALAFARVGRGEIVLGGEHLVGRLAPLPLRALAVSAAALNRCESIGVRTVGALLRLPRSGLAQRFGPEMLLTLDRLVGRASQPRRAFRRRERFRARTVWDAELTDQTALQQQLAPTLAELERYLRARQCGIDRLRLRLVHRRAHTDIELRSAAVDLHADRFARLLAEHLARCRLSAPVLRGEWCSGPLQPFVADSERLWSPGEQGGGVTREAPALLERLRARLGAESVYALCLVPEHRPEAAWQIAEPALMSARPDEHRWQSRRPLWLLREPEPIESTTRLARLQRLEGPERIETGWWDGREITRDYYVMRDPQGVELWVYRERQPPHAWFLHGIFG